MQDFVCSLPDREKKVYSYIRQLPREEKELLWELIQLTNREGVAVYYGRSPLFSMLLHKRLVLDIPSYRGEGMSCKVLYSAPYLLRKLRSIAMQS